VLIVGDVYEAFRDRFLAHVGAMTAGPSMDEHTDVCAMINLLQAERVVCFNL